MYVSNGHTLSSPGCQQSGVACGGDKFGVVRGNRGGAVGRVISPKPVLDSQIGGVGHECLVEFDHVDARPQIVENGPPAADVTGCDPSHALGLGKSGHRLDVGQSRARDAVSSVPELTAIR